MSGVLVHEWIAQSGGSENVLEVFAKTYPDADIVCLWNDSRGRFEESRVTETWLARSPFRRSKAAALPLMPATWASKRRGDYDFALVSSHLFAHHVRFAADVPRFVYVHSPARYLWTPDLDRRGASLPVRALASIFKPIDRRRARETGEFAANSEFVRDRIRRAWDVDSHVVYPPVEVARIQDGGWAAAVTAEERTLLEALPADFVLGASRFIPYKQLDQAIRAGELTGRPVVLAGNGPELAVLRQRAAESTAHVTFVLSPSNAVLYELFSRCSVYVFPPIEDFGIMPVEAMAAGASVVANRIGGAAESVADGVTGALTDFASDSDLIRAVDVAAATSVDARRERARRFDTARFQDEIRGWVAAP